MAARRQPARRGEERLVVPGRPWRRRRYAVDPRNDAFNRGAGYM